MKLTGALPEDVGAEILVCEGHVGGIAGVVGWRGCGVVSWGVSRLDVVVAVVVGGI